MKSKKNFKHIRKSLCLGLALGFGLMSFVGVTSSQAASKEEDLQKEITQRLDQVGGDWQVAIKSLDAKDNIDLYFTSEGCPPSLPAASSIKTFIGLSVFDRIERGALEESPQVLSDISSMLTASDNTASNRLINDLGGFDRVNRTIFDVTGRSTTSLNRFFLHKGPENMTSAYDLNLALERIYRRDYVSPDHSQTMIDAMAATTTRYQKLLGSIKGYDWAINKSGELPDRGVENDSVIIKTGDRVFAITVLSRSNNIQNRGPQLQAFRDVGKIAYAYFAQTKEGAENPGSGEEIKNPNFTPDNIYTYKKLDLDKSYLGYK